MTNATNLGVPSLHVVVGAAPKALDGLQAPDAVFIGGGGDDDAVFRAQPGRRLKPGGRLVANAVTLESEQTLARRFAVHGGELIRLSVERLVPVGGLHSAGALRCR